jgi:hypothetical protein
MFAIDIYWKQLQKIDNWYAPTKKFIYQYSDLSDIENKFVDYKVLFKIQHVKVNDYLFDIPIININNTIVNISIQEF